MRAPSLRGLPGDEVLVQINGKRFNRSALVQVYTGGDTGLSFGSQGSDISAIPSIAINNLQVLRDGATAQYGSDAIAGVHELRHAQRPQQSRVRTPVTAKYSIMVTPTRSGKSRQIAGTAGSGSARPASSTSPANGTRTTAPAAARRARSRLSSRSNIPSLANQLPNYPLPAQIWGSSPQHGWKGMVNAGIDVTDNSQLYVTGLAALQQRERELQLSLGDQRRRGRRRWHEPHISARTGRSPTRYYLTPCPAGNATCPAGGFVKDSNTFLFTSTLSGRLHAALRGHHQGALGHGRLERRAWRRT